MCCCAVCMSMRFLMTCKCTTANLRTKIMDFGGIYTHIIAACPATSLPAPMPITGMSTEAFGGACLFAVCLLLVCFVLCL